MIQDSDLPELSTYRRLERDMPIELAPQMGEFVVPGGLESSAIHRWFKYKEAYSPSLPRHLLSIVNANSTRKLNLLDPFCGVGTTLVSAQTDPTHVGSATGIECNPLSAFVARTKVSWPHMDVRKFENIERQVLEDTRNQFGQLPALSSITTGRCISKHIAKRLVAIRDGILDFPESPERNALLVGLASSVEPLSHVRKDGRALRIVDRPPQRLTPVLVKKWDEIKSDIIRMRGTCSVQNVSVIEGDGRQLAATGISEDSIDVVITSPPYPNNIDYSEVYKLELWLLGFINSADEFLRLRKSTLRSHPTSDLAKVPDTDFLAAIGAGRLRHYFGAMLGRTESFAEAWRTKLALGYFSDIWVSLREQRRCLRKGAYTFLVVANSLHGSAGKAYLVPTDLLVGQIGLALGFELERIMIARSTKRRLSGNHFLRESIVVLRKSDA